MQHKCFTVIIKPNTAIMKLKISIVKLCKKGRKQILDVLTTKWCIEYDTILLTIKWRLPSQVNYVYKIRCCEGKYFCMMKGYIV